jgi:hypothetical protein
MMCCQPLIVIDCRADTAAFPHGPIMMTEPINVCHRSSVLRRVASWWRSRRDPRFDSSSSVHVADDGEAAAPDGGVNEAKPRTLAGKWPDAANSLKLVHLRCDAVRPRGSD